MLLQLVADYYRSVIENERLYYEHLLSARVRTDDSATHDQLPLQRQINRLTGELQSLVHENDRLRDFQKTQKQVLEAKIQGLKKNLDQVKSERSAGNVSERSQSTRSTRSTRNKYTDIAGTPSRQGRAGKDTDLSRRSGFHLLSPMNANIRTRSRAKTGGLKDVLKTGKHTIFDDTHLEFDTDSDDENSTIDNSTIHSKRRKRGSNLEESMEFTSDNTNDIAFLDNLKVRDKSNILNLPSGDLSPDEDSQSANNTDRIGNTKRRRLAKRRIQTMDSDSSELD
ncbi:Monopolin complex subunit LRS4 [Nakaseomyces bracarensis]|uniref:Monopolin complex subunit LRS4 n=1 Tax=Nakaseomyces bracarensis TaxID=273131 RepID=A0ABR4NZU9_9SACH